MVANGYTRQDLPGKEKYLNSKNKDGDPKVSQGKHPVGEWEYTPTLNDNQFRKNQQSTAVGILSFPFYFVSNYNLTILAFVFDFAVSNR